ncbi:molybdate transport system ATP-binding protein [Neorhizobium galegae]|uniref:molybdenum ABC transporter ATP-binding protein n=1 Tax=Neorhizobium galegae TaxID=399 RepID=UPI001AE94040|nr:molybdenum ABC transporter ATP-binding protein [Neorhizobium galegae]MBP2561604.1 molybdate transport system ATP-binding protein [Neorhizobium galegae]
MTLTVKARQTLGEFVLDAGFTSDGGVTALFGPSGSGKTSLVRVIAGLSKPEHGRLVVDGETLLDTESRIFVPKHRRRFGYVFQESRLFPHLSVRQNLAYGRWFAPKTAAPENFDRIVELLGIGLLLDRRPGKLSGGEKQRVAIGRALLSAPRLLLMDEPLAALDDLRKAEILPYLERLRDETSTPIVYVSHSVSEVARLADNVVIMKDGQVEAVGTPSEVLSMPSTERRDAGVVLTGTVETIDIPHRLATIRLAQAQIVVPNARVEEGRSVRVHIPERDVMVATQRPEGLSALNILEGAIAAIEPDGDGMVRIRIRCGGDMVLARITALSADRLDLRLEKPVFAVIKTVALER